jgi:hypothetical protein
MADLERYPSDPHNGAVVLRTALRLLDAEPFPTMPPPSEPLAKLRTIEIMRRINGLTNTVYMSIGKVDPNDADIGAIFAPIYEENLDIILRWLRFNFLSDLWKNLSWNPEREAPKFVFELLNNLRVISASELFPWKSLWSILHSSEDVIDLLLAVWLWRDRKGVPLYLDLTVPGTVLKGLRCGPDIMVDNFRQFCAHTEIQHPFSQKISGLSRKEHRRFVENTLSRMKQWKLAHHQTVPSATYGDGINSLLSMMSVFQSIPGIAEAVLELNLAEKVMKWALAQGGNLLLTSSTSSEALGLAVGNALFYTPAKACKGNLQHGIIIQLLKAGFLNIVLDGMFERHASSPSSFPFYEAHQPLYIECEPSPFKYLATFCVNLAICEATCAAVSDIPEQRMRTLEDGWAAPY